MFVGPIHKAARAYAQRLGWWVFPCNGKAPAIAGPGGFKHATTDIAKIDDWFFGAHHKCTSLGIWPGASGLLVIDVDRKPGKADGLETLRLLQDELGPLPDTPVQLTGGGGMHYVFALPEWRIRKHPFEGHSEIEALSVSEYFIAAPSAHPSGKAYAWESSSHPLDTPVAALPNAWIKAMTGGRKTSVAIDTSSLSWTGAEVIEKTFVYQLADALGLVCARKTDHIARVMCPWHLGHSTHTVNNDSSAAVLAPKDEWGLGHFRCLHASCAHRRTGDLIEWADPWVVHNLASARNAWVRAVRWEKALTRAKR